MSYEKPPEGFVGGYLSVDGRHNEPHGPYVLWVEVEEGKWVFSNYETLVQAVEGSPPLGMRRRVVTKVVRYQIVEEA
jgi:hypothetical protein